MSVQFTSVTQNALSYCSKVSYKILFQCLLKFYYHASQHQDSRQFSRISYLKFISQIYLSYITIAVFLLSNSSAKDFPAYGWRPLHFYYMITDFHICCLCTSTCAFIYLGCTLRSTFSILLHYTPLVRALQLWEFY